MSERIKSKYEELEVESKQLLKLNEISLALSKSMAKNIFRDNSHK